MREMLDRPKTVDYQVARSNEAWSDHRARTLVTAALIAWLKPDSVLDPACGDGSIIVTANRIKPIRTVSFADISEPNITYLATTERRIGWTFRVAAIEEGMDDAPCDVIVLTEVLEHLVDPDAALMRAQMTGRYLVASSPEMRPGQNDTNPEHLWQFDRDGYRAMLEDAGWKVEQYTFLQFPSEYDFGIWVCS